MAAPDEPPQDQKKGMPLWIIIVGGAALGLFLWMRNRGTATQQGPLVPAVTTDPNTGMPIDPLTGMPFSGTPSVRTTQDWITSAESYAQAHHMNLGLVAQAIFNWTNGLQLSEKQAGVLQRILGGIGYPPESFPWHGPTGGNPTTPKGPYFNWSTWKWWGITKGEAAVEPKFLPKGSERLSILGKVGSNILMPLANAPIYALVPRNWTASGKPDPGSGASGASTGPLTWRRIDNNLAFSALPKGTQVSTFWSYAPAAA